MRVVSVSLSLSLSLSLSVCVCVCVFISYQSSTSLFLSLCVCLCLCVCVYLLSIYLPSQSLLCYWILYTLVELEALLVIDAHARQTKRIVHPLVLGTLFLASSISTRGALCNE